MNSKKRV